MENDALRGSSYEELTVFFLNASSSFGSVTHKSAALLRDRSSFSISSKHADIKQHTTTSYKKNNNISGGHGTQTHTTLLSTRLYQFVNELEG